MIDVLAAVALVVVVALPLVVAFAVQLAEEGRDGP